MIKTAANQVFKVDIGYPCWTEYAAMPANTPEKPSFSSKKTFLVGHFKAIRQQFSSFCAVCLSDGLRPHPRGGAGEYGITSELMLPELALVVNLICCLLLAVCCTWWT